MRARANPLGRILTVVVLVAVAAAALPGVSAEEARDLSGDLTLGTDFVVAEGETVKLLAGSNLTGAGRLLVRGTLLAEGAPGAPVRFEVPVTVDSKEESSFRHVSFEPPERGAPALTVKQGRVRVDAASFKGGTLKVNGTGSGVHLEVLGSTFAGPGGSLLALRGGFDARVEASFFRGGATGLEARFEGTPASRLVVTDSHFLDNADHARVEFGLETDPGHGARFLANDFDATAFGAALRVASPLNGSGTRSVFLAGNLFHDAAYGLRVTGGGYRVDSWGDTYRNLSQAAWIEGADVRFHGAAFEGNGQNARVLGASTVAGLPAPVTSPAGVSPWLAGLGGGVAGAALAAGVLRAGRRGKARPVSALATESTPPAPESAPADPDPALPRLQQEILKDLTMHPGSSQSAVAKRLGVSRQALHYHVKKLEEAGRITKRTRGRHTLCYLVDPEPAERPD